MVRDDFAVFILSHGRADIMKTVGTLKKCGYTGKWYIICDNEDTTIERYYELFGKDNIIIFDKTEAAYITDTMDLIPKRNSIVFARNMCHSIAKNLGLNYFLELEDDYTEFRSRPFDGKKLASVYCRDLDSIINVTIDFLDESGALTVAFAQTGDYIGGTECNMFRKKITRKAMNSFFCRVDKPFKFFGRMNDDVNAYTTLGSRGELFFTISDMSLNQMDSQQTKSGNTDMYREFGTYCKSFYSVMCSPSCVSIAEMGCNHRRIHHLVDWNTAVPKIISSKFKVS